MDGLIFAVGLLSDLAATSKAAFATVFGWSEECFFILFLENELNLI